MLFRSNISKGEQLLGHIGFKLFSKLRAFYNDKEFVTGVMQLSRYDEGWQQVIDYMDTHDNLTRYDIEWFAGEVCKRMEATTSPD